jgi:hypothetical protein
MRMSTLPRHARTGQIAVGWRKPRPGEDGPQPVWPILGGAEDDDTGDDDQDDDADESDTDDDADKGDDGDDDKVDHKAEAEKHKALSRKWEQRAKANAAAAKELAKLKREGMSDLEKKVDEAVSAARAEERVKAGERVARSAFLAAAKGRLDSPRDVADELNLRKYVDPETGDVDDDAIAELVDKIAPKQSGTDGDDDDQDERDTRRRRRQGRGYQGARNGSGRSKDKRGSAADGAALYEELIGPRRSTAKN